MFVQYMCKQSEEELAAKEDTLRLCLAIESVSLITILVIAGGMRYWLADQMEKNDEGWLTTSDYSVYIEIAPETS